MFVVEKSLPGSPQGSRVCLPPSWLEVGQREADVDPRVGALVRSLHADPADQDAAIDFACLIATKHPRMVRAWVDDARSSDDAALLPRLLDAMTEARVGDATLSVHLLAAAIHDCRLAATERMLAWALVEGGRAACLRGEKVRSLEWLEEGLSLARQLDVKALETLCLIAIGMVHGIEGRSEAYAAYTEQALAVARTSGDHLGTAMALCNLGGAWCSLGRRDEAAAAYVEVLTWAESRDQPRLVALVHAGRAGLAFAEGDAEAGVKGYAASEALLTTLGDSFQVARQAMLLAQSLQTVGRFADAAETLERAIRMARAHALGALEASALDALAECLIQLGRIEEAHDAFRSCIRLQRVDLERQVSSVRKSAQRAQSTLLALKQASWERARRVEIEASNQELAASLTEQEALRRELERASRTDALTGLANRRAFDERFRWILSQAARHGRSTSLALLDADHFKSVNDTHGHDVGDEVLVELARRAVGGIRATDLLARWGGEEFVVLLPETDAAGALAVAEKLVRGVRGTPFATRVGPLPLTASVGVATLSPGAADGSSLLRWADEALYAAKRGGRDRVMAWNGAGGSGGMAHG